MTAPIERGWFLDPPHTSDEVLVLLAREAGHQAARDELTRRHWGTFKVRFFRLGLSWGLCACDLDDAHQSSFFWIQEAIRSFDFRRPSLPHGSGFRAFLQRVFRLRCVCRRRSAAP
jgi:hypothetical protein